MVEVLVEYDYSAQEPDELTIKKGDIIKDVIRKPGGWWEGTLHDKKGVFPDNFVKPIEKDSVVLRNKKDSARIRQCRVVFSYNQDHEDELNLKVGDLINIICEEEEGWWRGYLNGKEGVFPSNFVEEVTPPAQGMGRPKPSSRDDLVRLSDEAPALPAKPVKQLCEVRFSYKAQNEDELSLKEGDIVTVLTKDCQDPGWWRGELNGKVGVFPDNFVSILPFTTDDNKRTAQNYKIDSRPSAESSAIKHSSVASQRKSLEVKNAALKHTDSTKTTPPLPGKKPIIGIKKSPSGSGSGFISKLKDKIVDAVDGATGSRPKSDAPKESKENNNIESGHANASVFDQVERRPLLNDVRANRARAPGRRLPTSVYKEDEEEIPGLPNGTGDHAKSENSVKSEDSFKSSEGSASSENLDNSSDLDASEVKPKLREWEKHKAPWLAEMKLNQAKRTSVSPVPDLKPRVLPPSDPKPEPEVSKSSHNSPAEEEGDLIDMSKYIKSPVELKPVPKPYKTPPNELDKGPPIKSKPVVSSLSPVNRHSIGTSQPSKDSPSRTVPLQPITKLSPKPKADLYETSVMSKSQTGGISSISTGSTSISTGSSSISTGSSTISSSHTSQSSSFTHTSSEKSVTGSSSTVMSGSTVGLTGFSGLPLATSKTEGVASVQMFNELLERVTKLEIKCEKQGQQIEDLKNRLHIETDMRIMLQEKMVQNSVQI